MKKAIILLLIAMFLLPTNLSLIREKPLPISEDLDPLVDIEVTVEINYIRSLEMKYLGETIDKIDRFSDPDFYVKIFINGEEFISPVWRNQKYIYEKWSATANVPDDIEFVNIVIQLWDKGVVDKMCDISDNIDDYPYSMDVNLTYSIKSGHWFGDDFNSPTSYWEKDASGYGRLNGCDDNSIYQNNRDCEIGFSIYQNDYDGDGIPYWIETNIFHTDPTKDNRGEDIDNDGIPIEWEYKWGHYFRINWWNRSIEDRWEYSPLVWDDHKNLDPDEDGLNNYEEYLTSEWGSDPFRRDLFIEIDQMEGGAKESILPDGAKEMLKTAYNKHNIVYHLDDGCMGGGGKIPFDKVVNRRELEEYYLKYFLNNNESYWRKGVFHYAVIVYDAGFNGYAVRRDMWQISTKYIEEKCRQLFFVDRDTVYASVFMHETGHSLNIWNPGVDNEDTMYPWKWDYWKYTPYKSCMNYRYTYILADYSDGSHGMNDFDDWDTLSLTYFNEWN